MKYSIRRLKSPITSTRGGAASLSRHANNTDSKLSSICMVFLPWLYFMAVQVNTATMPKYIHWILSSQVASDVDDRIVQLSSLSATVYGNMCAIDSLFTFFSVNFLGCVSDYTRQKPESASKISENKFKRLFRGFGRTRRPFMFLSSFGLGISHVQSVFFFTTYVCMYVCPAIFMYTLCRCMYVCMLLVNIYCIYNQNRLY